MTEAALLEKLKESAKSAARSAYCPHSGYAVGAAVLADDGRIFDGCNIENASYSLTVCAERVAVFKAVSAGAKKITALYVYSDSGKPPYPCGACRQVLSEFCDDATIVVSDGKTDMITSLEKLLPYGFR